MLPLRGPYLTLPCCLPAVLPRCHPRGLPELCVTSFWDLREIRNYRSNNNERLQEQKKNKTCKYTDRATTYRQHRTKASCPGGCIFRVLCNVLSTQHKSDEYLIQGGEKKGECWGGGKRKEISISSVPLLGERQIREQPANIKHGQRIAGNVPFMDE